jgi:hypothetical protein
MPNTGRQARREGSGPAGARRGVVPEQDYRSLPWSVHDPRSAPTLSASDEAAEKHVRRRNGRTTSPERGSPGERARVASALPAKASQRDVDPVEGDGGSFPVSATERRQR